MSSFSMSSRVVAHILSDAISLHFSVYIHSVLVVHRCFPKVFERLVLFFRLELDSSSFL